MAKLFLLLSFVILSSLSSAQGEDPVQYEVMNVRIFDSEHRLVETRESLLKSTFNFRGGTVEHVLSFLEDDRPVESKTFLIKRKGKSEWILEKGSKLPQPVSPDSSDEYRGFKYVEVYPDGNKLVRMFVRREDGTMKIVSSRFSKENKRTESSLYKGTIITKREYEERLDRHPVK